MPSCPVGRCFLLLLALCSLPAAAAAEPPPAAGDEAVQRAKAHFAQGKLFYEQGNYQLARAEFEESYRLSRRPDLLFNLALVAEKLGGYREAADYLMEYLRQRPDAPDRREIRRSIEELERRDVARRQKEQPEPPTPAMEPTAPAAAPEPAQQPLARPVLVPVTPKRRVAPPWPAFALMGGGVVLLGVGLGLGGAAMATARSVEQRFDPAEHEKGQRLQAAGIALDVIGAAALVAGGAWGLGWIGRRERAQAALRPRGLGFELVGSF